METDTGCENVCVLCINESSRRLGDLFNQDTYQYFSLLYFIGSLFSIVSLLIVVSSYLVLKPIRKHPAHLVLCRVASDFIVSITHIVFYLDNTNADKLFNHTLNDINSSCRFYSPLINFGMFSGYAWNFIMSVDLLLAVKRPFQLHGSYLKYYHAAVWTVSAILTLVFIVSFYAWKPNGMSMFFHCWVNVEDFDGYIAFSGLIYYIPTSVLFVIGCIFVSRVLKKLKAVALFSPEIKSHITKHSLGMLCGLGVEWLLTLLLWLVSIIINLNNVSTLPSNNCSSTTPKFGFDCNPAFVKYSQLILTYSYVTIHSVRGCIVLAAWLFSIYIITKAERKKRIDTERKINIRKRFGTTAHNGRHCSDSSASNDRERRFTDESNERRPLVMPDSESSESGLVEYMFNSELRRYAVVCINYSLLDSAKTAQSQITGDNCSNIQQNVTLEQVILKSESRYQGRNEVRTIQIPAYFMYHKFQFINYSPLLFKNLRDLRGIDGGEFMKSFPLEDNETAAMAERFTEGKSGSFFYYSHDKKYIVKTINKVEMNFMVRNIQKYYKYLKNNRDSLLTRYYNMLKLRFSKEQEYIYVVVMENVFYLQEGLVLEERYDLKGSITNRQTLKRGMERSKYKTMKDMDLDGSFKIDVSVKDRLLKQLDKDTNFLRDIGSMDYSLLMGVTINRNEEEKSFSTSMQTNVHSETEKEITIVGEDLSYDWVSSKPEDLHWYRNGKYKEHTPSKVSDQILVNVDTINPAESIFTHFRRGFFRLPGEKISNNRHSNRESHEREPCYLYLGLIDVLQPYDLNKKSENFVKTKVRRLKESHISAVEPGYYKTRFMRFMRDSVFY